MINKLPTDQQLAQVHRDLDELLFQSFKRAAYETTVRSWGIRALHQHTGLGDTKPFMFPTRRGWKAGEKDDDLQP